MIKRIKNALTAPVRKIISTRSKLQDQWRADVKSGKGNYHESIVATAKRNKK